MRRSNAILKAYHCALAGPSPFNVTLAGEVSGCKGGVPTDEYIARPASFISVPGQDWMEIIHAVISTEVEKHVGSH